MSKHTIKKLPKSTVEITLTIPWADIATEQKSAFAALQAQLEVPGFRRGKAPKDVAEKHIARQAVLEQVVRQLLPRTYEDIVKKEGLRPIISPKIDLVKAKEKEDWEIKINVAEKPEIKLGSYKDAIKKLKVDAKTKEIWTPGKEADVKPKEEEEEAKQNHLNMILGTILTSVTCDISDIIIEDELNRKLARLVDDVQKLGLTMEAYLQSKNTTMEQLRAQFTTEIENTYKLEFILMEIADIEKITVGDGEIDAVFANIKDEKEKQAARQNAYFYTTLIRKQKTLDYLLNL